MRVREDGQPVALNAAISGMLSRWVMRPQMAAPTAPLSTRILAARGLHIEQEAHDFLTPSMSHLHDPSLMPGLDKAAARLIDALRSGQKIAIYGDYDVDGVTATSVLYHTFQCLCPNANITTYVPHRIDEGYGLNTEALRQLADSGSHVIVTVDCGITAVEPARELKRHSGGTVDLIITDHHNLPAEGMPLPDAYAHVHPRLPGSRYPFGELCGAAVAYKLAWRIGTLWTGTSKVPDAMRTLLIEMLALVSMGIVADVVPLVGENRVLASFGLARIKNSPLPGLKELVAASGLDGENVAAEDVGFKLAPRLNASGRLGHAREAVELLTIARGKRAQEIAAELSSQNELRQAVEKKIVDTAIELAVKHGMTLPTRRAIVLASTDWHAGVVGIACSRLVEKFHRPVILLGGNETHFHGSGRSVHGFSLHSALQECRHLLETFGGHDMAAGVKVRHEQFARFQEAFIEVANRELQDDHLLPRTEFDTDVTAGELTPAALLDLKRLEPFGRDNPRIQVRLKEVKLNGRAELMGKDLSHLSMRVGSGSRLMRIVGWRMGHLASKIPSGAMLDVLIHPKVNEWNGSRSVEGEMVDFRIL